jgi:hypothetical protein
LAAKKVKFFVDTPTSNSCKLILKEQHFLHFRRRSGMHSLKAAEFSWNTGFGE